jgi:hypothetical protein
MQNCNDASNGYTESQPNLTVDKQLLLNKNMSNICECTNRPLKWFDDGVDVGRFIRGGNEEP